MQPASPPLTPLRAHMSPGAPSPASPSFPGNEHSPSSRRKRFSDASHFSSDSLSEGYAPRAPAWGGNLADELGQLEDDEDDDDDTPADAASDDDGNGTADKTPSPPDGARDSGIDVSYPGARPHKPVRGAHADADAGLDDRLPPSLDAAIHGLAHLASSTPPAGPDALIARTLALLRDLGSQASLESGASRLSTSTNSMAAHLSAQSKALAPLLYTLPASSSAPLATAIDALLLSLPLPDPAPLHALQRLARDSAALLAALALLTDDLHIAKQAAAAAARHLRCTAHAVAQLRRERERADEARAQLAAADADGKPGGVPEAIDWPDRIARRWCARQCRDILAGFENTCDVLRASLVATEAIGTAA